MNETKFLHSRTFLRSEKGRIDMLKVDTEHRAPIVPRNKSTPRKSAFRKRARRIISGNSVLCDPAGRWKLGCSLSTQELSAEEKWGGAGGATKLLGDLIIHWVYSL